MGDWYHEREWCKRCNDYVCDCGYWGVSDVEYRDWRRREDNEIYRMAWEEETEFDIELEWYKPHSEMQEWIYVGETLELQWVWETEGVDCEHGYTVTQEEAQLAMAMDNYNMYYE